MIGDWTPARVERLKSLWAAGESCSAIADALGGGFSRNAVIGKAHRLNLAGRQQGINPLDAHEQAKHARHKIIKRARRTSFIRPIEPAPVYVPPPLPEAPPPRNLTILEVGAADCRWPVTTDHPMLFCGHVAVLGLPYCGAHTRAAYRPSRPRT